MDPIPDHATLTASYDHNYFGLGNVSTVKKSGMLLRFLRAIKRRLFRNNTPTYKFYRYRKDIFGDDVGNFLDVGCATGVQDIFLMKDFPQWNFFGVEPDESAFNEASRIKNFSMTKGVLENTNYPDGHFDVILINHVLEHITHPGLIVKECQRILKKGGRLIIAVPDFDSLSSKFFKRHWYHLDAPRHLYQFNTRSLEYLLKENGFLIERNEKESLGGSFLRSMFLVFNANPDNLDRSYVSVAIGIVLRPFVTVVNRLFEYTGISSGIFIIAVKKS